jgi:hypothetical protein
VEKATLCLDGKEVELTQKLVGKNKIDYFDLIN